jgi:hypothetical protein
MKRLILHFVLVLAAVSLPASPTLPVELTPKTGPYVNASSGYIIGLYRSSNGAEFDFSVDRIFTYKLAKTNSLSDGAYESNVCTVTNTQTGEVIKQGNFLFYYQRSKCCYNVKLVSNKLLVLNRVWDEVDSVGRNCPNLNLRSVPK